jgi:ZIP family zinc transporter
MNGILTALLLTLIAGAATGIGGAMVLFKKKISSNFLAGALGLSAGVMIFISLAELFPEAQAEITAIGSVKYGEALTLLAFFAGMGIIMLIDFLVPEYENPHEATGLSLDTKTAAKSLHKLGIMSALAIAIHNFPEGIAVAIPIYYATKSKGTALLYATLSGFSELIGAMLCMAVTAIFGVDLSTGGPVFPLILAAVAGIMVYISLDELLPTAEKYGKHHIAIAGVISGMAIMGISLLIL